MALMEVASGSYSGPGSLGLDELPPSDPQAREDRESEHDDPHPAQPLRELAPHQHRLIESRNVREDARACRRHPGHGLEVRVDRVAQLWLAEEVREGDGPGGERPCERHDQEALTGPNRLTAARHPLQTEPDRERDGPAGEERPHGLAVADREDDREEKREAEVLEQPPDEVQRPAEIDAERPPPGTDAQPSARDAHARRTLQRPLDVADAGGLGEDDGAVPRTKHVVPVREDRGAVAHDRADQRPG